MAQKIYFGNVIIMHTKTRETQTIERKLFKECDNPNSDIVRSMIMRHIKPKDRKNYKIIRFCFETAKYMGDTAY